MKDYKPREYKQFEVTLLMNIIGQIFIASVLLIALIGN